MQGHCSRHLRADVEEAGFTFYSIAHGSRPYLAAISRIDLVVRDPPQALHEQHHDSVGHLRHLLRVVDRAARHRREGNVQTARGLFEQGDKRRIA